MRIVRFFSLTICALLLSVASASGLAQSAATPNNPSTLNQDPDRPAYRKGVIEAHFGANNPGGDLRSAFSTGPGFGVTLGWRFHRFLQADLGFDSTVGAADVRRDISVGIGNTPIGTRQVGDNEFFIPAGLRVILPLAKERVLLSAGGGASYLRYSEAVRTNSNETINCFSCTSRSGSAYYGLFQPKVFVDKQRKYAVGVTARFLRGQTSGESLGTSLSRSTKDRWTSIAGTFAYHF